VTGEPRVAEAAVREALLLAWTQSDADEPAETLGGRLTGAALRMPRKGARRIGADRRARSSLAHADATGDAGDVRRALARLSWRQREVAVLRYALGKESRDAATVLGIRERAAERSLADARAALSAALLREDDEATDDALAERFEHATRHGAADPQLFEGLVASMTRRETTKRVRTVVVAGVTIALAFAIIAVMNASPSERATPTPTTEPAIPADAAALPGVPFPACHVSVTHSFASSGWFGVVYIFGKGSPAVPCLKLGSTPTYLALDTGGAGRPSDTVVFGPIQCELACRAFATADIDGDGWAELGVVVADRTGADAIELYRVRPDALTPIRQMTTVVAGSSAPFSFEWGGAGPFRSGAICTGTTGTATPDLDVWHAMRRDGVWHLRETFYAVHGVSLSKVGGKRSSTNEAGLPESLDFCGMPVGF
jgi:DNA-directed RNA polymerase specialized sigma24 family protein